MDLGPPRSNDPPELHLGAASIADVQCGEYLQFGIGDTKSLATQCSMLPKILHPLLQTYTCDTRDDPMESHYAYVRMYYIYIYICVCVYRHIRPMTKRAKKKNNYFSTIVLYLLLGFLCENVYTWICMIIHTYTTIYVHTHMYVCMYVCMYICIMYVCMYVCCYLFIELLIYLFIYLSIYTNNMKCNRKLPEPPFMRI